MANPQEKLESVKETTPLSYDDFLEEDGQYYEESAAKACGCGCFEELCFRWQRSNNNGGARRYLLHQQEDHQEIIESWLKKRMKKVKEISEVLAGPKWKTLIRRFSMNKKRKTNIQFQYDPQSYKLNFDDGLDREVDCRNLDFSARYAAPVIEINKGGELGRETAG